MHAGYMHSASRSGHAEGFAHTRLADHASAPVEEGGEISLRWEAEMQEAASELQWILQIGRPPEADASVNESRHFLAPPNGDWSEHAYSDVIPKPLLSALAPSC